MQEQAEMEQERGRERGQGGTCSMSRKDGLSGKGILPRMKPEKK